MAGTTQQSIDIIHITQNTTRAIARTVWWQSRLYCHTNHITGDAAIDRTTHRRLDGVTAH